MTPRNLSIQQKWLYPKTTNINQIQLTLIQFNPIRIHRTTLQRIRQQLALPVNPVTLLSYKQGIINHEHLNNSTVNLTVHNSTSLEHHSKVPSFGELTAEVSFYRSNKEIHPHQDPLDIKDFL
uniref:Uncharacterized protein n=1 Tax=Cacopsylla melanoneura TaxID=428564 RepID=A0A8D8TFJ1_9HEMI